MPWRCPVCNTENTDDVDVCRICGAYRPTAATVSISESRPAIPTYYRSITIEVLESSVKGLVGSTKTIDLTVARGVITIGRALDNHFVIPDPSVSRRHLRVVVSSEGLVLEDLGSTNGTYLLPEGRRINVARAGEEATVRLGNSVIRLTLKK